MLNLREGTIKRPGDLNPEPIKEWVVWFTTPYGLCETAKEASAKCEAGDIDPELCVMPVPVAIGEDGTYEVVVRSVG